MAKISYHIAMLKGISTMYVLQYTGLLTNCQQYSNDAFFKNAKVQ